MTRDELVALKNAARAWFYQGDPTFTSCTSSHKEGAAALTTVEARGTSDRNPAAVSRDREPRVGRAAGAQVTGQRQDGPSQGPACEQYPRATHGGVGPIFTDLEAAQGSCVARWPSSTPRPVVAAAGDVVRGASPAHSFDRCFSPGSGEGQDNPVPAATSSGGGHPSSPASVTGGVEGLGPAEPAWYDMPGAHEELAALLRWLARDGHLGGVDEAIHVCEKPWHYAAEREAMTAECDICEGNGCITVTVGPRDEFGNIDTTERTCEACGGTGRAL